MLSSFERRIWDDVERRCSPELQEPVMSGPPHPCRPDGADPHHLPGAVVAGVWITVGLVLLGFLVAALAVGALTTVVALLWRCWPRSSR